MNLNIPNLLTLFRGVATLIIIALFLSSFPERYICIYILFVLAALSDYLDGKLSRRWNTTSDFGAVFDPLFDKILVLTLIVLLYPFYIVPQIILLILLIRDIATDVLRSHLLSRGITTPAIYSAKLKTTCQMFMLNFMLLFLVLPHISQFKNAAILFGILAVVFSLWSGGIYLRNFATLAKKEATSSST